MGAFRPPAIEGLVGAVERRGDDAVAAVGGGGAFGSGARRNGDHFWPASTLFKTPRCVPAYTTDGAAGSRERALT